MNHNENPLTFSVSIVLTFWRKLLKRGMFSPNSMKFFSKKNQNIYKNYKKKPNNEKFINLIQKGIIPRPYYALGLLLAARQAYDLGFKEIKVIELGCHNFDGLIDIEQYVNDIKKIININIKVFGFTLKSGLPKYKENSFNRLYRWQPGSYKFDKKNNYNNLKLSKIFFGDVKNTIPKFLKKYKPTFSNSPIGFVISDLDYYKSTKIGLNLFKLSSNNYLPRTYIYFDDHSFSSIDEGERKAITEFNKTSKNKISDIHELAEQLSIYFNKWIFLGKRLKVISYFKHKMFNKKITSFLD